MSLYVHVYSGLLPSLQLVFVYDEDCPVTCLHEHSNVTEALHLTRGKTEEDVAKQPWAANLQVKKRAWCWVEADALPSLAPKVSLLVNIFRLKRMKELKQHFCMFLSMCGFFFRYKFQEELGRICIDEGNGWDRLGRTAKESGVTISFLGVSWPSQIFPVPSKALLSYFFSLQAENDPDLRLPGRKQRVSLQLTDKITVTGHCPQFFSSSSTQTFPRSFKSL